MKSRLVIQCTLLLLVIFAANPAAQAQEALQFHSSLPAALESSGENSQPIVLYFGADWCAPCQRMRAITFDLITMDSVTNDYQWVKYDIDDSPEIATTYGVVSVPTVVVLNSEQAVVGTSSGFMAAERLLDFIADVLENPQRMSATLEELGQLIDAAEDGELAEALHEVLEEYSSVERADRDEIKQLVVARWSDVSEHLVELAADDSLRIRAAAFEILSARISSLNFDPFAEVETRARQLQSLRDAVAKISQAGNQ